MITQHFAHVRTWVFDLDNTLYPPSSGLFARIEPRMTDFVMRTVGVNRAEADRLRQHYWDTYGTTLAGLMAEHGLDPAEYLIDVHDISFDSLTPDAALADHIAALPGRRVVFTNATAPYAERVLEGRGLSGLFDAIYGVEHAGFTPKPHRAAFETVFARDGLSPQTAAMFEDDARNLSVPHAMGMRTVHVAPSPLLADHIHYHTDDLTAFLSRLLA